MYLMIGIIVAFYSLLEYAKRNVVDLTLTCYLYGKVSITKIENYVEIRFY